VFAPGDAREDWTILRALSRRAGRFGRLRQLRRSARRWFADVPGAWARRLADYGWRSQAACGESGSVIGYPIKDFYLTNAICRASPTMQRCSAELLHGMKSFAEAAE
jgi:NADH-quinone oxidoreductase subunit G